MSSFYSNPYSSHHAEHDFGSFGITRSPTGFTVINTFYVLTMLFSLFAIVISSGQLSTYDSSSGFANQHKKDVAKGFNVVAIITIIFAIVIFIASIIALFYDMTFSDIMGSAKRKIVHVANKVVTKKIPKEDTYGDTATSSKVDDYSIDNSDFGQDFDFSSLN